MHEETSALCPCFGNTPLPTRRCLEAFSYSLYQCHRGWSSETLMLHVALWRRKSNITIWDKDRYYAITPVLGHSHSTGQLWHLSLPDPSIAQVSRFFYCYPIITLQQVAVALFYWYHLPRYQLWRKGIWAPDFIHHVHYLRFILTAHEEVLPVYWLVSQLTSFSLKTCRSLSTSLMEPSWYITKTEVDYLRHVIKYPMRISWKLLGISAIAWNRALLFWMNMVLVSSGRRASLTFFQEELHPFGVVRLCHIAISCAETMVIMVSTFHVGRSPRNKIK